MGIGAENPYWDDVLAHGVRFALRDVVRHRLGRRSRPSKVVLPVLGDELDAGARARRDQRVERRGRGRRVISTSTASFRSTRPRFRPSCSSRSSIRRRQRCAAISFAAERGAAGCGRCSRAALSARVLAARPERDQLSALLRRQRARRRCESKTRQVFDEDARADVSRLVGEGLIDGLRVDHVDGLLDPQAIWSVCAAKSSGQRRKRGEDGPFPIVVEKILMSPGEQLRRHVAGAGNDWVRAILNDLEDLFVCTPTVCADRAGLPLVTPT